MQRKRGLLLGRPSGLPLRIHGSWFPAGALLASHLAVSSYGGLDLMPASALGVATAIVFFGCVAVHTYAHVGAARVMRAPPRERHRVSVRRDVAIRPAADQSPSRGRHRTGRTDHERHHRRSVLDRVDLHLGRNDGPPGNPRACEPHTRRREPPPWRTTGRCAIRQRVLLVAPLEPKQR